QSRGIPDWKGWCCSVGGGSCSVLEVVEALFELRDLLFGGILGDAVLLLDDAGQPVALARDHRKVVIGELAPLLSHAAGHFLPFPFDLIPVHRDSPFGLVASA